MSIHPPAAAFPRMARYLAHLPDGLDSYPQCAARASVLHSFATSRALRGLPWKKLLQGVAEVLRSNHDPDAWVSEVRLNAAVLALADHLADDDGTVLAWLRQCNEALLKRPVYNALVSLSSPSLLSRYGLKRFQTFHRGVGFGVETQEQSSQVTLTYPPFLFTTLLLRGHGEGMRSALAMARAKDCKVSLLRETPLTCTFHFEWR